MIQAMINKDSRESIPSIAIDMEKPGFLIKWIVSKDIQDERGSILSQVMKDKRKDSACKAF